MIKVVFWSQTGNTEAMANAVVEGIQAGRLGSSAPMTGEMENGCASGKNG